MSFLFFLAALLAAAPVQAREHRVESVFSCRAPGIWAGRSDWAGPYPVYVLLRAAEQDPAPRITIESFTRGNALYPEAKSFLNALRKGRKRERPLPAGKRKLAGSEHTLWERSFTEPTTLHKSGTAERIQVVERFVLLNRKNDFLVLRLKSPASASESGAKEFDAFLESCAFPAAPR